VYAREEYFEREIHVNSRTIPCSTRHKSNFINSTCQNLRESFGRFIDILKAGQGARIDFYRGSGVS
jgi:hypothetical protein